MGAFSEPLSSQDGVTDGYWHHVGLVWDGLQRHLYLDGVQVAEDGAVFARTSSTGSLYIGAGRYLESGSFFSGLIDDVRIYNVALTPAELEQIAR